MDIADYVNEIPPSAGLPTLSGLLREEKLVAPIDMFRRALLQTLAYGTPQRLDSEQFLGRLLVLRIISAAEAYFRAVLSACIEFCPVAQAGAASKAINLGGLLWHGQSGFSRSAFEHVSFTSRKELKSAFSDYLSIQLDDGTFRTLLDQYEVVCHLRHGIVHGDGLLPGRNAVQLDIPKCANPVRIVVDYAYLQQIASVVTTLVVAVNRVSFAKMCERWAVQWRQRADWDPSKEKTRFHEIWSTFHSADERKTRQGRSKISRSRCLADLKSTYNV